MTRPQPRYKKGDKIGGQYQVHQVKMGGMGEVYLCLDLATNEPFALKTFQQCYQSAALRKAFEQEVATWVALEKHPNIVRCYWMQVLDNQPFMCLEWIAGAEGKGADLRGWLRRGPLDLRTALDITLDVVRGLIHAQEKQPGLVHRDLKPENILVAQGGLAKITDFGLAQIVEQAGLELTPELVNEMPWPNSKQSTTLLIPKSLSIINPKSKIQNPIVGTPAYMAPEQWRGELLDERTDIYAIGCILYELLTASTPIQVGFTPTTPQQFQKWLRAMQESHESDPLPTLPSKLSAELNDLVVGCLAKARMARPSSLGELMTDLEQVYWQVFNQPSPIRPATGDFTAVDYTNRGATYINLKQYETALADFGSALELDPTYAQAYYNRGTTYQKLQQPEAALTDFGRAIELDPTDAMVYLNRGATYADLQLPQAALADFGWAIELDPTWAKAYANRGNIYADLQQPEAALTDFGRAIELDPMDAMVYLNRGITYADLQQPEAALSDFERAIELDPTNALAYLNRGNTYADLQQSEAALADYERVLELEPTYAQAYYNRGTMYQKLQQPEVALVDFGRAIELDPTYVQAYANRGITYAALGQYKAALADYGRAIELDPTYVQAYSNRGTTYAALQQPEAALADFGRAIDLDPTLAPAYFNLAVLLANIGQLHESLSYFEKAANLGFAPARQAIAQVQQRLGESPSLWVDPTQQAFEAFQQVGSPEAMQQAVAHFPFMIQADFIAAIEQVITQQVPPEHRPHFEQRLAWLRRIAQEQNQ